MRDAILGILLFLVSASLLVYRGDYAELNVLTGVMGVLLVFKE